LLGDAKPGNPVLLLLQLKDTAPGAPFGTMFDNRDSRLQLRFFGVFGLT
jgi:hypothetical protein